VSPVALTTLGFRRGDATDVRAFQAGWALGPALDVDGLVGPKTTEAMELSVARLKAGQGSASRFFSFTELACECSYSDCRKIWVRRGLLKALDVLREKHYPGGLTIVSGCRCTRHNADVYRAKGQKPTDSIHIYGAAVDIPPTVPVASRASFTRSPRSRAHSYQRAFASPASAISEPGQSSRQTK